jgi:CBS domain-containing protein
MGSIDPAAYLRSLPPFDTLAADTFEQAARSLVVAFHPAGTWLARAGAEPLRHLYVIRKGAVRLERDAQPLQLLEEGEMFGYTSLLARRATIDVVVERDLVAYQMPGDAFESLLADAAFARHFALGVAERFRASVESADVAVFRLDLSREVGRLLQRDPVWTFPDARVGDAARLMRQERISSLLVRSDPPGIVTDTDLRSRVLAEGLGPDTRVSEVCTSPLLTVPASTPISEAWTTLLDTGVHHLPLTSGKDIVGMLTSTDFLRVSARGPVSVLRGVERLASRESLRGYGRKVAEMAASLLAGGLDATVIAGFVARLNDALTTRILEWAEADLGPAPAPYAWIVFGSEGRMEQTLLTDQDNALVYADDIAGDAAWFGALAAKAKVDLVAAGFPECPGGYMATNWHGTLTHWRQRFSRWIDVPSPKALLEASIFFDFRPVAGSLGLEPLDAILAAAAGNALFLRWFARTAMEYHPPPSFLLAVRGESSIVDLKAHAVAPIVHLARCYGLEAGTGARSTMDRLDAALRCGFLTDAEHASITDAFRFVLALRLQRQLSAESMGSSPTSQVALSDLKPLERTRLKEALRSIASWQEAASHHFQTRF